MAKSDSIHGKQDRVRPARVRIKYEVFTDGAIKNVELPFVAGVLGDFSGQPEVPLPDIKERQFVEVKKDTFDDVLKGLKPRLNYSVENKLDNDGSTLSVELNFQKLADFEPEEVVKQVQPLRDLLDLRQKLKDLRSKAAGRAKLEDVLNLVLQNTEQASALTKAIGESEQPG